MEDVFFMAQEFSEKMANKVEKHVKNNTIQSIHREGFITGLPTETETKYTVSINGESYKFNAREGLNLVLNDIVIIASYNGDLSKSWIDLKRPW